MMFKILCRLSVLMFSACSHLASFKESGPVEATGEKINLQCIKNAVSAIDGISNVTINQMSDKLLEERKTSHLVKRIDYLKGKITLNNYRGAPGDFVFSVEQCTKAKNRFLLHISAPGLGSPALVDEVNSVGARMKDQVSKKCGLANTFKKFSKEERKATYCPES